MSRSADCLQVLIVSFLLAASSGCATRQYVAASPIHPVENQPIVYVANGAGGLNFTTSALRRALESEPAPIVIEEFEWSHGFGRILSDQLDWRNVEEEGRRLARVILAQKAAFPNQRVSMLGHSAGAGVILVAAGSLPPNTVERIVLLSPSVSADYDIRPALRASRLGVDVFSSRRDFLILGFGVRVIGTADGQSRVAAGRHGFRVGQTGPDPEKLLAKLHEHPWDSSVRWTGHDGGHHGSLQTKYLRAYVLPLLLSQAE